MIIIDLVPASAYDRENYGILFDGAALHTMTGRGVHSRHHPHRIQLWDNSIRPNNDPEFWSEFSGKRGPGAYVGPDGKGTDAQLSIVLNAQAVVISAYADPDALSYGDALAIGDVVQLRYPDGTVTGAWQITARDLADPVLVPVDMPAPVEPDAWGALAASL